MTKGSTLRDTVSIVLVSSYFVVVGTYLALIGRVPAPGVLRALRALMRSPYAGVVDGFKAEEGYCFIADLPADLLSDREHSSSLLLFEDERPIGPAHVPHDAIRTLGRGRFSHWGDALYFSSSDNSDPRTNKRRYSVREQYRRIFASE